VVSILATAAHPIGSSVVMLTAMEHLVSASGTVAITSFVSVSTFSSSAVA
jgi:hypothetical protein